MLSRIQNYTSGLVSKANLLSSKALYYGKVGAEISKQIYLKEGLQPPTVAQFKSVYSNLYKQSLNFALKPTEVLACLRNIQKNELLKYGAYGIQLIGFYSVGEIIGRRKLVGYKHH
ncbi:XXYS1_4_G0021960.mRNA.1.CDS.1 [Saccharomyces cerevisiae]|nr:EM14S01-3B_G0019460.mRNA.1.CDS.1 [Saccharomyces cerevisiae]CAD6650078.1 XXYS1_4_G0021960.mRNA.1.CDS.1 [Saccharomyces cerevisiae]CAI4843230.1 CEI_1a_G0055060.mRNA.1.CDS.1 [Saccharomyces cerevisiae]CAI4848769.1 AMH_1a_G0055200.mRNA.1.CDS.1 [Saccharomyces cerevisiae]CAI6908041.1 AMH_1a_G0055200.mRNA.1.CDS.1 [Saccharomyces cerevisiae]